MSYHVAPGLPPTRISMKFLFDFFPILLFFVAYKVWDIYVATAVAIAASFVQVGLYWLKHRRTERMHLITLGLLVLFGGLTLILQDPVFIKWKPTIVNWLFATVFLGSQLIGDRTLVERMMSHVIKVDPPIWRRVNLAWVLFFVISGAINLYVAYNFSENTWVNFKLFGLMGLTIAFVFGQAIVLARYVRTDEEEAADHAIRNHGDGQEGESGGTPGGTPGASGPAGEPQAGRSPGAGRTASSDR
jgi:intracellular septation protein